MRKSHTSQMQKKAEHIREAVEKAAQKVKEEATCKA
jgi:hypothetical protein